MHDIVLLIKKTPLLNKIIIILLKRALLHRWLNVFHNNYHVPIVETVVHSSFNVWGMAVANHHRRRIRPWAVYVLCPVGHFLSKKERMVLREMYDGSRKNIHMPCVIVRKGGQLLAFVSDVLKV